MRKEKIIEKLKKLFALGQSPNQHEAEAAMAKANEIMTEYQISATDIDLSEDGPVMREEYELDGFGGSSWVQVLADGAAKIYDAKCYRAAGRRRNMILRFYGTPADILAAKMTFNHLFASWESIVKLAMRNNQGMSSAEARSFRRAHGTGYAVELISMAANVLSDPNLFAQEGQRTAGDIRAILAKVRG